MADNRNDRLDLLSKDLEFVKEVAQSTLETVKTISTTMERNTISLEKHERRTELAELRIDSVEAYAKNIHERVKPLEEVFIEKKGAWKAVVRLGKLGAAITGICTAVYTVLHLFSTIP